MQSVAAVADASVFRPTQLIAEALIDRHDSSELTSRAQRLGISPDLTEVVVKVCCREQQGTVQSTPHAVAARS